MQPLGGALRKPTIMGKPRIGGVPAQLAENHEQPDDKQAQELRD